MNLIKKDKLNITVSNNYEYIFEVAEEGIYGIEIIANAKSWWQNFKSLVSFFKDDDLALKIDNIEFPKQNGKAGLFDGEVAWNGNNLKGLSKTNIFIINLNKGSHKLEFLVDQKPFLESIAVYVAMEAIIEYIPEENNPAQDGNRRQWMTIIPVNMPIKNLNINASAKSYPNNEDDDDIRLIINGDIQKNELDKSHENWFWCGKILNGQEKEFNQELNLPSGLHYIELWADRMPVLSSVNLDIDFKKSGLREVAVVVWKKVSLMEEPNQNSRVLIGEINSGTQVDILEKAVLGERPANKNEILLLSDRWHKIEFQGKTGYVYCEALEIEGEGEEKIKELILTKAKELDEDGCLIFAVAKQESKLFPYAVSVAGAQGLFQLMEIAISDVNKKFEKNFSDRLNIEQSIESGILYFKIVKRQYQNKENSLEKTLAAWNFGMGNIAANEPLILKNLPQETNQFVKEVIKSSSNCSVNKGGRILISWLIGISFCAIILFFAGYFLFFEKKEFELPKQYKDYSIIKKENIDIDKDGVDEKIVIVSNISTEYSNGITKMMLVKKDGTFLEMSGFGSELQWQQVGDFNKNGKTDVAVSYGYSGSGGFGRFYLYEWEGEFFSTILFKEDVENRAELKDLDNDGIKEVVYNFKQTKWGKEEQQIYGWNDDKMELYLN